MTGDAGHDEARIMRCLPLLGKLEKGAQRCHLVTKVTSRWVANELSAGAGFTNRETGTSADTELPPVGAGVG